MTVLNVYAVKLRDRKALYMSSSGGAFSAFSDVYLEAGNAVVCAQYDYSDHRVKFRIATSKEERNESRGSMYVQADMDSIFRDCVKWLNSNPGKKIIFFGLGCQAASFKNYMTIANLEDRITIVDIICHGAPSPSFWQDYIKTVSSGSRLTHVNFRDKKTGWDHSVGTAIIDGREISIQDYRRIYSSKKIIRPSCFICPYAKMDRDADITIGDYWHIEKYNPDFYDQMGVSLVIIHSEAGQDVFEKAKNHLEYISSNTKDCWQLNLEKPTEIPSGREQFWDEYRSRGMGYIVKNYGIQKTIVRKIITRVKQIIKRV